MTERKKLPNFHLAGAIEYKEQKLNGKFLYAEKKMDGQRGVIIVRNGIARAYTKNGCKVFNAGHILKVVEKVFEDDCMLDGEWLYKKDFNQTQSIVMTQSKHELRRGLTFNAFDRLTLKEWKSNKCKRRLSVRKAELKAIIVENKRILGRMLTYVAHTVIYARKADMLQFMHDRAAEGHEGGVYKDPDSFYAFTKSRDWWKLKPHKEMDCRIIGAVEGRSGKTGKYVGKLGALILRGHDPDRGTIEFQCSGMTDKNRDEWWKMHKKKKLVGKTVEVKHEGITVNNAVRFPSLLRLKLDKVVK